MSLLYNVFQIQFKKTKNQIKKMAKAKTETSPKEIQLSLKLWKDVQPD